VEIEPEIPTAADGRLRFHCRVATKPKISIMPNRGAEFFIDFVLMVLSILLESGAGL